LPAAAVQHASSVAERRVVATLDSLVDTLAREQIGSPAVLVIGRVLDWAVVGEEVERGGQRMISA
jgi:uroporphyrin-III C-methyltransferase